MASIRSILLDADGVVQATRPGWRESLAALAGDPARVEEFLEEVFAAERPCARGEADFRTELSLVLDRWQCDVPVDEVLSIWTMIDPHQPTLDVARRLRAQGLTLCLATNQQRHRARYMRDFLNYRDHFDHLFISCELGVAKPEAAYFNEVVRRLGVTSETCLFIDDSAGNVASARDVGLAAEVWHFDEGQEVLLAHFARHGIS